MADRGSFHLGKAVDPATGKPGGDDLAVGSVASKHGRAATASQRRRHVERISIHLEATGVRVLESRLVWVPGA